MIITSRPEQISQHILEDMHHGVTKTAASGAFTNKNKTVLHTVCRRFEAAPLRKMIREIDPHAFVIITTSNEIIGRGFRSV